MAMERSETTNSTELLREQHYPQYVPKDGVGSNVGIAAGSVQGSPMPSSSNSSVHTADTSSSSVQSSSGSVHVAGPPSVAAAVSSSQPSYFPLYGATGKPSQPTEHTHGRAEGLASSHSNGTGSAAATPSTDGINTPSTNFGYSPYPTSGDAPQMTSSSIAESGSPDWLPSPVAEEREDQLSPVVDRKRSEATLAPGAHSAGIEDHLDQLSLQGISVVPSTSAASRGRSAAPVSSATPTPAATATPTSNGAPVAARSSSQQPVPASASPIRQQPAPPAISSRPSSVNTTSSARPELGAKKQSVFGKLFHHKEKPHNDGHASGTSSGYATPDHGARPGMGSRVGSSIGDHAAGEGGSHPARQPSANGRKEEGGHGIGSFLSGRKMSNKKMAPPDPALLAMAKAQDGRSALSTPDTGTPPNGSTVTLSANASHAAIQGSSAARDIPSSTVASRGSTPDVPSQTARAVSPSPARQPAEAKPMSRRPSASAADKNGGLNGETTGRATPSGGQPVTGKSLKEHLASLGNSAGIGKLNRKTSQTGSRRSDDGKSEKSHHGDEHHGDSGYVTAPTPRRAPSVGGQSNASTSLTQKYGVCEKVAIGKGATAVVRLAHKWDRSTEKLYAVKEFRKRRKNETEKEYVKKLTSEFCISSTLHHINVVETVDLVQNEEKHWCEVMEYCPGGDLYAAIKKGDMSSGQMNIYFKQIITGVAYLHSMGVAHRDIKPENLLLDNQGHVKITDFGVSDVFRMCWEKQTHMSKGLCGSEPYIAPEQFDQKEYDARLVDVWACAVVFYCMQAQELPWRVAKPSDPSFQSFVHHYATSPAPPPLGNLHPKECRVVIKKMLDPNPKTRIGMDAVLADAWMKSIDYEAKVTEASPLV